MRFPARTSLRRNEIPRCPCGCAFIHYLVCKRGLRPDGVGVCYVIAKIWQPVEKWNTLQGRLHLEVRCGLEGGCAGKRQEPASKGKRLALSCVGEAVSPTQ